MTDRPPPAWLIEVATEQDHKTVWVPLNDGEVDYAFPSQELADEAMHKFFVRHQPQAAFRVRKQ